jgi:hypothetical protein
MHRDAAQRRHHVADPGQRTRAQGCCQRLQRLVGLEVQLVAKFGVNGRIAKRRQAQRLEKFLQENLGTATPIMQSRVTMAARRSSLQLSVPAGRIGSTR